MKSYCSLPLVVLAAAICSIACPCMCLPASAQAYTDTVVGPGGSSPNSPTTPNAPNKVVVATTMSPELGSGTLTDTVVTKLGRPQDKLTFTITNKTKNTIDYEFNSGRQFEVEIDDSVGKEVWLLSKSTLFPPLMSRLTLKPGRGHTFTTVWNRRDDNDMPVPPGTYTALATLMTMPRFVVTGTSLVDVQHDQDNPTRSGPPPPPGAPNASDGSRGGTTDQTDVTPPVQAKTSIMVAPTTP
jgi:hypothetical protein